MNNRSSVKIEFNSWLVSFSKNYDAQLRLFCFPYAGGGAGVFRDWHHHLPDFVELICIQPPGRETRFKDTLISDLNVYVAQLSESIPEYLDLPYIFFGHSVGALIGHELLLALGKLGITPAEHFVISGHSAPTDKRQYYEKITHLSDAMFLERLPDYGGTPDIILNNPELMEVYLPILRSDFLLSEHKQTPNIKLDCPISVMGGEEDRICCDNLALWAEETSKNCDIHVYPGGHFFINESKQQVLDTLNELILNLHDSSKPTKHPQQ